MQNELDSLRERIAEWSLNNFGSQKSKVDGHTYGYMLPLLGIGEEIGEYERADSEGAPDLEVIDAIADIVIYLCDFASRLQVPLRYPSAHNHGTGDYLSSVYPTVAYSDILHHILKMHQGIRGYENIEFALSKTSFSCTDLLLVLINVTHEHNYPDPVTLATNTFNAIVSKRDWKTNPNSGEANA